MTNPKVKVFGTISEKRDGGLLFTGFTINADGSTEGHRVIIIRAVIDRLQHELQVEIAAPANSAKGEG